MSAAEEISLLQQNLEALLQSYASLQQQVSILTAANKAQLELIRQNSAELLELRAKYRDLQTAHNLVSDGEAKLQARRRLDSLISRIDQTIDLLQE